MRATRAGSDIPLSHLSFELLVTLVRSGTTLLGEIGADRAGVARCAYRAVRPRRNSAPPQQARLPRRTAPWRGPPESWSSLSVGGNGASGTARRVTELIPASPLAFNNLGAALEVSGDIEGAAAASSPSSVAIRPRHWTRWRGP